jgi:uncharacterized protein YjiS (DUF1127 family)
MTISALSPAALRQGAGLKILGARWLQALRQGLALYRSRQDLRGLSDAQLKDIGVTRHEAAAEARRGFHGR